MGFAWLLAALGTGSLFAQTPGAPYYTAASIANAAANVAGLYAPNAFVSIYGRNLAYVSRAIGPDDIRAGTLPTVLIGTGVRVLINNIPANVYYVSPGQVNVLIPVSLIPGPATLQVINSGLAGPPVSITLGAAAPSIFQADERIVIATHGNGPLVTESSPARRGETVVLYATGLGPTAPAALPNQIPQGIAPLARIADFRVLLNGETVDPRRVAYAGSTPGFAGLFQVNLQTPENAPENPEIRIGYPDQMSPTGRILPLR
jgi:uncharacterized protein (TIGR03437 family)